MTSAKPNKNISRFLATMSLLIFFLPFFQTCSDEAIKETSGFIKSYSEAKTEKEKDIAFLESKDVFSVSGYELGMSFEPVFFGFTVIMCLNIVIVICLFRSHKTALFLSFINLGIVFLTFVTIALMFLSFSQIRYGMFLCLLNALLLFYFVYKEQEQNN